MQKRLAATHYHLLTALDTQRRFHTQFVSVYIAVFPFALHFSLTAEGNKSERSTF